MSTPSAGPTRPENPNPRPGDQAAPQSDIAPPTSTNDITAKSVSSGASPAPSTSKKRKSQTLADMLDEARKKRRLDGEEFKVRKQAVQMSNTTGQALAPAASSNILIPQQTPSNSTKASSTTKKSLALKGTIHRVGRDGGGPKVQKKTEAVASYPAKEVAPSNTNTKAPASKIPGTPAAAAPKVAKKPLWLKDRMLKRAREERIEREAEKAAKAKKAADKPSATGQPTKEKRKVAWDDDQPDPKKPRAMSQVSRPPSSTDHTAGTTTPAASTPGAESPLHFTSTRERHNFYREQSSALQAIKSVRHAPAPEKPTVSLPKEDHPRSRATNHSGGRSNKPASDRSTKAKRSSPKKEHVNGQRKHHTTNGTDAAVNRRLGGGDQVKSRPIMSRNKAPQRCTTHPTGKSPAIENDSGPETDSDSDTEAEARLSPRGRKQQERQTALNAFKNNRLARQASRRASSQLSSPPAPDIPAASSSQPTAAQPIEPPPASPASPVSPVADCITALESYSCESSGSVELSGLSRASLAEVRKFFKD